FGTCAGVRPAAFADWNRALVVSTLQPFHVGIAERSPSFDPAAHWFGIAFGSPAGTAPSFRPPTNSANPRFNASVRSLCACAVVGFIVITAYTASGVIFRSASRLGAWRAAGADATPALR